MITDQIKNDGFSINRLDNMIKTKKDEKKFNTQEYFCICIVLKKVQLISNKIIYTIQSNSTIFLGPYKNFEFTGSLDNKIFVITFSSDFYERSIKESQILNSQLFFNYKSDIFVTPFINIEHMKIVFLDRMESFRQKDEVLYRFAVRNAIEKIMLDASLYISDQEINTKINSEYLYYINKFRGVLQRDYRKVKKVSHYANELNITSRKLTEMSEKILGKSAKRVIIEKIITESEKMLRLSNDTISQISYKLGFDNEGNFTNFFKKHKGIKPSLIRKLNEN
jgi:AraC family transcriptional regulator, transcriptional activator of pobA